MKILHVSVGLTLLYVTNLLYAIDNAVDIHFKCRPSSGVQTPPSKQPRHHRLLGEPSEVLRLFSGVTMMIIVVCSGRCGRE